MRRPGAASRLVAAAALVALLAAAVALQVVRDRWYGAPAPAKAVLYIRSGEAVKRMALSYAAVLADVYWIRTVQYFGATRLASDNGKNYNLLYPLLDITTTLDPHFNIAYRFGAIFLAEDFPGGAARPDLAVALLEKGIRYQPRKWQFKQDVGFVYYWWRGDYISAARWFEAAAQTPGAPWWMQSMAAVTLAEGGDRRSSRVLWQSLLAGAENDWLRNEAHRRLLQLDALDQIDQLQTVVRAYERRFHSVPAAWEPLVSSGYLRGVPVDPTGVPYVLDPGQGTVTVASWSRLHPLPTGQQGQAAAPSLR